MWSWYLLQTKPRQEKLALDNLQRQGYSCYMPHLTREKVLRKQLRTVVEPLFPRYLFIQLGNTLDSPSWTPVRSTYGVSNLVRFGNQPAAVEVAVIEQLRLRESLQGVVELFQPGDRLSIIEGPLAGIECVFQMQDAQQRCLVLLNFLQRRTVLPVDAAVLRKIS